MHGLSTIQTCNVAEVRPTTDTALQIKSRRLHIKQAATRLKTNRRATVASMTWTARPSGLRLSVFPPNIK